MLLKVPAAIVKTSKMKIIKELITEEGKSQQHMEVASLSQMVAHIYNMSHLSFKMPDKDKLVGDA